MKGKPTTGMVLGKFMPPHLGHLYLCEFAQTYVEDLTIVVGTLPSEPIPGELRFQWMRELFPHSRVVHLPDDLPQQPEAHPEFWRLWEAALLRVLPARPEFLFASEKYGHPLARILGAEFVPVDLGRGVLPVSGTAIRNDPWTHWQYLPRCVQPFFLKRICVFGPESTGKSTLARDLARHYGTVCVPEYALTLISERGSELFLPDIERIARGQQASEAALARGANRLLVCDTDLLTTTLWSDVLFGECPQWVREAAEVSQYDLYLLLDVDVPWVDDIHRYLPEERRQFFDRCEAMLKERGRPYVVIRGGWEERFRQACAAIEGLFAPPSRA